MSSQQSESPKATIEIPTVSFSHEAQQSTSEPQPSPIETRISNQPPPIVSSPVLSSSGSHHSRKNRTPKNFVVSTSPSTTKEKMQVEGQMEGKEVQRS